MSSGGFWALCLYQYIALCPRRCSHFNDFLLLVPMIRCVGSCVTPVSMETAGAKGQNQNSSEGCPKTAAHVRPRLTCSQEAEGHPAEQPAAHGGVRAEGVSADEEVLAAGLGSGLPRPGWWFCL